ncbi:MAG: MATE family efflux transporter [Treponema sp.]|nr:MATE family efflux transporter [Treponema sp.]
MSNQAKYNLTEGPIFNKLLKLSVPIMATSLMQSAHNLTNMFWLGRLGEQGEQYVAAAGLAGQFLWMSFAFIMMCRIGAEIGVSQNMGRGNKEEAISFAQNGFMLSLCIGLFYSIVLIVFRVQLLSFFNIDNEYVAASAATYLSIAALAIPLNFGHTVFTGVYGGFGNTKLPFYVNSSALLLNIVLSPILIFIFNMGILGAATSMVIAAIFNFVVKIWAMTKYRNRPFENYVLFVRIAKDKIIQILKWGLPVAAESLLFALLFMLVTRLIAGFGYGAVAAHQVGMQVESLSFMIGGGFASALTAFIGQNYGAKKWGRMVSTRRVANIFMAGYGILITAVLFFLAEPLVSIFLNESDSILIGGSYLRIIALAQLLFCLEGVAIGSFRGRGITLKPTIASVSSNIIRVFVCYALANTRLGVSGVWWGIAMAMTIKSVWLLVWHYINIRKLPRVDECTS